MQLLSQWDKLCMPLWTGLETLWVKIQFQTCWVQILHRNQKETKQMNILCESICLGHFEMVALSFHLVPFSALLSTPVLFTSNPPLSTNRAHFRFSGSSPSTLISILVIRHCQLQRENKQTSATDWVIMWTQSSYVFSKPRWSLKAIFQNRSLLIVIYCLVF